MNLARKLWRRGRTLLPSGGFYFDRPLVLFQSDDWGRVGVRDHEGWEQLRAAGIELGGRPYDFYTLETAADLGALSEMLQRHRDSVGRNPCVEMNFILSNLDFAKMAEERFQGLHFVSLADGLPQPWSRPRLIEAYREGIAAGVLHPALHGMTHFCRSAVERGLSIGGERADLLRTFWRAGTPYIHWRMPWIGYEYWDAEKSEDDRFLSAERQRVVIGEAVGAFAKLFSGLPHSACAPGYRANEDTNRAWAKLGIRVAQNGPGAIAPPHFDHELLQVCRTVEFEPAVNPAISLETCVRQAENCFRRGIPAIVSVHSINFHCTVRDFRSRSIELLDEFLRMLESRHDDLLYLHDADLFEVTSKGCYRSASGDVQVNVRKKNFMRKRLNRVREA